jgi:hypothetical protein
MHDGRSARCVSSGSDVDIDISVAAELKAAPSSALAQVAIQSIGDRDVARACPKTKIAK